MGVKEMALEQLLLRQAQDLWSVTNPTIFGLGVAKSVLDWGRTITGCPKGSCRHWASAHFEGDLGFHPAEEFAIRYMAGQAEPQKDPLPPQVRVQFKKMKAGQSVPPSPVTATPAAEAIENKLPKTNQDRSANVQPRVV